MTFLRHKGIVTKTMSTIEPAGDEKSSTSLPKPRTWKRFILRWAIRSVGTLVLAVLSFVLAAWILGNTPVNTDFQHAGDDGIEIMLINNGVHVDVVVPANSRHFHWLDLLRPENFRGFESKHQYAIFGWGNRKFYLETRTWNDLKVSNVLYSFAGLGETVVHVSLTDNINWPKERSRKIRITPEQFVRLSNYLLKTFKQSDDESLMVVPNAHYDDIDAFYEAKGHYHLFRTCNVWAGGGLAEAGVRVGYWTLTPDLLFSCLPEPPKE